MEFYIGTAGFSYKDWEGIFYPKNIDKLNYYSSIFNFVEINSTFYEIPLEKFFISFSKRLKNEFKLSIKANKIFTHKEEIDIDKLKYFIELTKILKNNLLTILFQFPFSFHNKLQNIKKLEKIRMNCQDIDIAIEVRHKSFLNEEFIKFCSKNNIIFVNIDQPQLPYNLPLTSFSTNERICYFRFHGRREDNWFSNNIEGYERYNYLYNDDEINKLKEAILKVSTPYIIVSFNNHYKAKAVINALELIDKIGIKSKISSSQLKKLFYKNEQNSLL